MDFPKSEKAEELLKLAKSEGGISTEEAQKLYSSIPSANRALNRLHDKGWLEKNQAPPESNKQYVYFLSQKSEKVIND